MQNEKEQLVYMRVIDGEHINALEVLVASGELDLSVFQSIVCGRCLWNMPGPRIQHHRSVVSWDRMSEPRVESSDSGTVYDLVCHGLGTAGEQIQHAECAKKARGGVVKIKLG